MTPERIPMPRKATLHFDQPLERRDALLLNPGDPVKTGQKLTLTEESTDYVISPVTGTVSTVSAFIGDFGASCTAVTIDVAEEEEIDDAFSEVHKEATLEIAARYLRHLPGNPPFDALADPRIKIETIVVTGLDPDLLVATNQQIVQTQVNAINRGISLLKKMTGAKYVIVALPQKLLKRAGGVGGASGAEIRVISEDYPSALPPFIMKEVLGKVVPAGKSSTDMGVAFFTAEAVVGVAKAFETGEIPVTKTLTVIKKDLSRALVEARIGTPLRDIFAIGGITLNDRDRIILGGPMTGSSIYTEDYPVGPETDAVMIQDNSEIILSSDYPCINCGECVRICPVDIPVNMLVRFCEARQYETGADEYDLYSCIECGLCTFVCPSRIPIFQYIRLAKYELAKEAAEIEPVEEAPVETTEGEAEETVAEPKEETAEESDV
jgi:electron transport complex protein RnfC